MQVGLFHTVQWPEGTTQNDRYRDSLDQATLAETLGFDSIWMTEHHFFRHGIVSDSLSVLAYLAGKTSTIRLGTAVSVLPLHNPVRLAEAAATIDQLSDGRFDFGIGKGYQVGEFKGLGVDMEDRETRFNESLDVILEAWASDEPFSHKGKFWDFQDSNPQPKPLQQPHPPIWMATDSDSGFKRIAENEWGLLLPQGRSPESIGGMLERYRAALAAAGKEYDAEKVVLARAMYVAETDEQAWDVVGGPYSEFVRLATSLAAPGQNPAKLSMDPFSLDTELRKSALFGSPETCVRMLEELREMGIERVIGFVHIGGLTHQEIVSSLELFAAEVLPVVQGVAPVSGSTGTVVS
jgi:probable F420-dependent oxidoreductase